MTKEELVTLRERVSEARYVWVASLAAPHSKFEGNRQAAPRR